MGNCEENGYAPTRDEIFSKAFQNYCSNEEKAGRWSLPTYKDWAYTSKLVSNYFGKVKIRNIQESNIRDFARNYIKTHNATVAKNSTIDRRLQHLRQYFNYLKEQGEIKVNPVPPRALHKFFRLDEFSTKQGKYIFSDNEVEKIKNEMIRRLYSLPTTFWVSRIGSLIALDTGMRPQEIQVVKWSNLVDDGEFKVFKLEDSWSEKKHALNGHLKGRIHGFVRQTLPLSDETLRVLKIFHQRQRDFLNEKNILSQNDYIMLNLVDLRLTRLGMPIGQANMNTIFKQVAKKVKVNNEGKQISCYTCRHTVASKWANTPGISLSFLAFRLGHSVNQLMKTYVHEDQDRSLKMMQLMNNVEQESNKDKILS